MRQVSQLYSFGIPRRRRDISKRVILKPLVLVLLYSPLKLSEGQYHDAKHHITALAYNSPPANITEAPSLRRVPLTRVLPFYSLLYLSSLPKVSSSIVSSSICHSISRDPKPKNSNRIGSLRITFSKIESCESP